MDGLENNHHQPTTPQPEEKQREDITEPEEELQCDLQTVTENEQGCSTTMMMNEQSTATATNNDKPGLEEATVDQNVNDGYNNDANENELTGASSEENKDVHESQDQSSNHHQTTSDVIEVPETSNTDNDISCIDPTNDSSIQDQQHQQLQQQQLLVSTGTTSGSSTNNTPQTKFYLSPPPHHQHQSQLPHINYYTIPEATTVQVPHPRPYSALISGSKTETLVAESTSLSTNNGDDNDNATADGKRSVHDMNMTGGRSTNNHDDDDNCSNRNVEDPPMNKKQKINDTEVDTTTTNSTEVTQDESNQPQEQFLSQQQQYATTTNTHHQQQPLNTWQQQDQQMGNWHKDVQLQQSQQYIFGPHGPPPNHTLENSAVATGSNNNTASTDYSQFTPLHTMFPTTTNPNQHPVSSTTPTSAFITLPNNNNDNGIIPSLGSKIIPPAASTSVVPSPGTTYSRKDKALGLLAQRLVHMYEERSAVVYAHQSHPPPPCTNDTNINTAQELFVSGESVPTEKESIQINPNCTNTTNADRDDDRAQMLLSSSSEAAVSTVTAESTSPIPLLSIDQTASQLLVERRRIYDIINILEALNVVTKKGKNVYWWHGLKVLETTFKELQINAVYCEEFRKDAERNGMIESLASDDGNVGGSDRNHLDELDTTATDSYFSLEIKKNPLDNSNNEGEGGQNQQEKGNQTRKNTKHGNQSKFSFGSLGQLTKKFLSLYLIGYDALSLGEATERLLGFVDTDRDDNDCKSSATHRKRELQVRGWKTKVRRLYDIANVLCSIGIIDKTSSPLSHKKCGNMLTSDGRAVHFHKNNQYFYWKFPKTPKEMIEEQQEQHQQHQQQEQHSFSEDAPIATQEADMVVNHGNDANPLHIHVTENPMQAELPIQESSKDISVPLEEKTSEVVSSIYEL